MKVLKNVQLLQLLFFLKVIFQTSVAAQETPVNYCGSIRIEAPFSRQNTSDYSPLLRHMIVCKSEKLYFRTSIGLFQISSIDYANKLLTLSHSPCSSASNFVSPQHMSAGFPSPSTPNSLVLLNCSNQSSKMLFSHCNDTQLSGCYDSAATHQQQGLAKGFSPCSVIGDVGELEKDFHPKQMNCTRYSLVYKVNEKFELGTRISFDVPDHVPNPCDQCEKPDGNCGAGLRCVCHPKKCKDKVISLGPGLKPRGDILLFLVLLIIVVGFLQGS